MPSGTGHLDRLVRWPGGRTASVSCSGRKAYPVRGGTVRLADRRAECATLDRLVEAIRVGESRALVVYGEPGTGKTVPLDYPAGQAAGCQVVRVASVQSEMELAFAGLHQVCAPLLDRLAVLPGPQAEAVRTAFGLSAGPGTGPVPGRPGRAELAGRGGRQGAIGVPGR